MNSFFKRPMSLTTTIRLAIFAVAVLMLIPVIIFVVYPLYKEWAGTMAPSTDSSQTDTAVTGPTGHILLNLTPIGGEPGLYELDSGTGVLNRYPYPVYFPHLTYDENMSVLVAYTNPDTINSNELWTNIYSLEMSTGEGELLESAPESIIGEVRRPQISPLGSYYTYEVSPDSEGVDRYNLNDWKIYLGELNEDASHVANGAFVNFAPDPSDGFLFIKNDGIYHYYSYADTELPVFEMESGDAAANNHFAVSSDYKHFALTNVGAKEVIVATIENWNPFTISELKTYDLAAFWPTFSPDGRYLAVQEVDVEMVGDDPVNSRLTLIDLVTGEREVIADLSGYKQMQTFINDWTNNKPKYE